VDYLLGTLANQANVTCAARIDGDRQVHFLAHTQRLPFLPKVASRSSGLTTPPRLEALAPCHTADFAR
jgi:hypothetical protein